MRPAGAGVGRADCLVTRAARPRDAPFRRHRPEILRRHPDHAARAHHQARRPTPVRTGAPVPAGTPMPAGTPVPAGTPMPADSLFKHLLPEEARVYRGYMSDLLQDWDMLALLSASPEARRRLRPLLRMYGIDKLPDCMRTPPRSRKRSGRDRNSGNRAPGQARQPGPAPELPPRLPPDLPPDLPTDPPRSRAASSFPRARAVRPSNPQAAGVDHPISIHFGRIPGTASWPPWRARTRRSSDRITLALHHPGAARLPRQPACKALQEAPNAHANARPIRYDYVKGAG